MGSTISGPMALQNLDQTMILTGIIINIRLISWSAASLCRRSTYLHRRTMTSRWRHRAVAAAKTSSLRTGQTWSRWYWTWRHQVTSLVRHHPPRHRCPIPLIAQTAQCSFYTIVASNKFSYYCTACMPTQLLSLYANKLSIFFCVSFLFFVVCLYVSTYTVNKAVYIPHRFWLALAKWWISLSSSMSVCLFFRTIFQKPITKLETEMFHQESWESI